MPKEKGPEVDMEKKIYVLTLRLQMQRGVGLEEAIEATRLEIENSTKHDSENLAEKKLLEEAAEYLRSERDKNKPK